MNKEELKVMTKDCVYSEDGITYMSDKQYNNYIDTIEQLQQENQKYKEAIDRTIEELKKGLHELDTRRREEVYVEEYIEESIDILEEVKR